MKKGGRLAGRILLVLYIFVLIDVLFLMRGVRIPLSMLLSGRYVSMVQRYARTAVNLVPFKTIRSYVRMVRIYGIGGGNRVWWQNLIGNLVLFSPMGCLLPLLFPRFRSFFRTVAFTACIVVCVELLQLFTFTGSCDIDDVILNVAGCMAGYVVYKLLFSWHGEP